jgi:hypothetical protein
MINPTYTIAASPSAGHPARSPSPTKHPPGSPSTGMTAHADLLGLRARQIIC